MRETNNLPEDGLATARQASRFLGIALRTIYKPEWRDHLKAVDISQPGGRVMLRFPVDRLRSLSEEEPKPDDRNFELENTIARAISENA
jgi:hypothetical protein